MQNIRESEEEAARYMLLKEMEELDKITDSITVDCHGTLRLKFDVIKMAVLRYTPESVFRRIIPPLLFYYCLPMNFTARCFAEKGENKDGYDRIFLNIVLFSENNDPEDHTGECDIAGAVWGKCIKLFSLDDAIRFAKAVKSYQDENAVSYLFKKNNAYYILLYILRNQIEHVSHEFGDLCEMMPEDPGECIISDGNAVKKLSML